MSRIRYVLMVVIDPKGEDAIGLLKTKGPEFLIGKLTFPGGKIEPEESVFTAASRELREETGVRLPAKQWHFAGYKSTDEFELHIVAARSKYVHEAKQMEAEPVLILPLAQHCRKAKESPSEYTPDFLQVVAKSLVALKISNALRDSLTQDVT